MRVERHDAVREQDRRPLAAAVAEVRGERRAAGEGGAADDVQERQPRRGRRAADLDELAVVGVQRCGSRPLREVEPAREPVDCAEVDERSAPLRLPEDARRSNGVAARIGSTRGARDAGRAARPSSPAPGTPLHTAWIALSDGCSCASARDTARSCTAALPTAVIASTAAPTAMPSATTSVRGR